MQHFTSKFRWTGAVIWLCWACVAFTTAPMTVQAQTYYYYPTSVPAAPSVSNVSNGAPIYYVQGTMGNQVVWYTYTPQFYQTTYTPQFYQTTYQPQYYQVSYQTQTAQAPPSTQPSATSATDNAAAAPSAGTTPAATDASAAKSESADATAKKDEAIAKKEEANAEAASDPYGFVSWLNSTRASYGLAAVGHDPNLSNWAAMNNNQQAANGMGHFVMGPARRQNAAMGAFANIGAMWMNSPAHRAALLDPTIRWIGIAGLGTYWTFNAN